MMTIVCPRVLSDEPSEEGLERGYNSYELSRELITVQTRKAVGSPFFDNGNCVKTIADDAG